jgi:hypothetical protein
MGHALQIIVSFNGVTKDSITENAITLFLEEPEDVITGKCSNPLGYCIFRLERLQVRAFSF